MASVVMAGESNVEQSFEEWKGWGDSLANRGQLDRALGAYAVAANIKNVKDDQFFLVLRSQIDLLIQRKGDYQRAAEVLSKACESTHMKNSPQLEVFSDKIVCDFILGRFDVGFPLLSKILSSTIWTFDDIKVALLRSGAYLVKNDSLSGFWNNVWESKTDDPSLRVLLSFCALEYTTIGKDRKRLIEQIASFPDLSVDQKVSLDFHRARSFFAETQYDKCLEICLSMITSDNYPSEKVEPIMELAIQSDSRISGNSEIDRKIYISTKKRILKSIQNSEHFYTILESKKNLVEKTQNIDYVALFNAMYYANRICEPEIVLELWKTAESNGMRSRLPLLEQQVVIWAYRIRSMIDIGQYDEAKKLGESTIRRIKHRPEILGEIEQLTAEAFLHIENKISTPEAIEDRRSEYVAWFFSKQQVEEMDRKQQEIDKNKLRTNLEKEPGTLDRYLELVSFYEGKGQWEDSRTILYEALRRNPTWDYKALLTVRERLARNYECQRDYESANKEYQEMIRLDLTDEWWVVRNYAGALRCISRNLFLMNKPDEARKALRDLDTVRYMKKSLNYVGRDKADSVVQ
jgi:tetratricopeptide (TPR) repeat protein